MKGPRYPARRVRVLINALHAKSGGGVTYLRNILPHLAADDRLELHLLLHREQMGLFGAFPDGVRPHYVDFRSGFLRLLAWEQLVLPVLARRMGVKVTFSPANFGPILAPNPVIMLRNALAVLGRESRPSKWAYWIALAAATFLSLAFCRSAIAVSDYARRTLGPTLAGLFRNRITVVHHGVDGRFTPDDPAAPREPDRLLAVSDVYVQKNLHTLIRALALAGKERPALRLLIAGRLLDAEYHRELVRLAEECEVSERIEFLGGLPPDALTRLYRRCTVFVFPSTVETFGNPLVEAMACGTPVICSDAAAMPEVAGDAALYVPPLDAEGMARTIIRVLDDGELRDGLARRSLERARHYSWPRTGAATAEILWRAGGGQD